MKLTEATPEQFKELAELEKTFAFPLSVKDLTELYENPTFRIFCFSDGDTVAAHCVLYRVLDEAEITSFAVRETLRGQGIGTEFMEGVKEWMKNDGAKIAYLEVRESNSAARRLYEKCGFRVIGIRKRFYEKPVEDAVAMGIEFPEK